MSKYGSRTDDKWAALREAVPSFADRWHAYTAQPSYNPLEVGQNIHEFGFHLDEVVAADPESLAPLFAVIERILPSADEDLRDLITINVLENLADAAEDAGVDLRRLARLFAGEETRRAWRDALTWTHPECSWDDERGLVPDWPRPVPVGRVRVTSSMDLPDTQTFAVDAELLDGVVRPGLYMWKTLSSCHHDGRGITAVEPLTSPSSSPVRLRILVAHWEGEEEPHRGYIAEGWYDSDEIVEIIEQLPPKWS